MNKINKVKIEKQFWDMTYKMNSQCNFAEIKYFFIENYLETTSIYKTFNNFKKDEFKRLFNGKVFEDQLF